MAKWCRWEKKKIENELTATFSSDWIETTAKETGMVKRKRKINPVFLFWVIILGFNQGKKRTLVGIKRCYEKENGIDLSDSSWYARFNSQFACFLKKCVVYYIQESGKQVNRVLSKRFQRFTDIVIIDSTIIRLSAKLASIWKATRSHGKAAGIKINTVLSVVSNNLERVTLYGENKSEVKTIRIGPWVKGIVLLMDLGYFKYQVFARIAENFGFYISRLKGNADPIIVSVNNVCRGNCIDVIGKHLREVLPNLKRQILDVKVEVIVRRRRYNGKQHIEKKQFRLIAVYNEEMCKYHIYITNLTCDMLNAEEIAALYRARWEIELIFKEMKTHYCLDDIHTKNPEVVEVLVWASILTFMISRAIYTHVRQEAKNDGKDIVRYTQMRWSVIFAENARDQLVCILVYIKFHISINNLCAVYAKQAYDPHVKRKRPRSQCWS
jgi:putative transposase